MKGYRRWCCFCSKYPPLSRQTWCQKEKEDSNRKRRKGKAGLRTATKTHRSGEISVAGEYCACLVQYNARHRAGSIQRYVMSHVCRATDYQVDRRVSAGPDRCIALVTACHGVGGVAIDVETIIRFDA